MMIKVFCAITESAGKRKDYKRHEKCLSQNVSSFLSHIGKAIRRTASKKANY
jgi:hypothetical protein